MKCDEFLQFLDADEGWREGDAAAHTAACASCAAEAQRMDAASAAFAAMRDEPSPPFLHTRVMAQVREEGAAIPWWKPQRLLRPAWAAPVLVLAIVGVLSWQGMRQEFLPTRAPVPQAEIAEPREMSADAHAPLGDKRIQTPPVDLPVLGEADKTQRADVGQPPAKSLAEAEVGRQAPAPPLAQASPRKDDRELDLARANESAGLEKKAEEFASRTRDEQENRPEASGMLAAPSAPRPSAAPAISAQGEAAKGKSANRLASAEGPKEYILVDLVDCTLRAEDGVEYVALNLPELQSPPPGVLWAVTVKRDGAVEVRDETGNWLKEATEMLQAKAPSLNLMPGRYRLGRGR